MTQMSSNEAKHILSSATPAETFKDISRHLSNDMADLRFKNLDTLKEGVATSTTALATDISNAAKAVKSVYKVSLSISGNILENDVIKIMSDELKREFQRNWDENYSNPAVYEENKKRIVEQALIEEGMRMARASLEKQKTSGYVTQRDIANERQAIIANVPGIAGKLDHALATVRHYEYDDYTNSPEYQGALNVLHRALVYASQIMADPVFTVIQVPKTTQDASRMAEISSFQRTNNLISLPIERAVAQCGYIRNGDIKSGVTAFLDDLKKKSSLEVYTAYLLSQRERGGFSVQTETELNSRLDNIGVPKTTTTSSYMDELTQIKIGTARTILESENTNTYRR